MNVVCLDLEGVLIPEIWINVAKKTGIDELLLTTRDIPDYDVLMKQRIGILKEHGLKLKDIQNVIATMEPLEGARGFLDSLRSRYQVIILSDTFVEFARPMMEKLAWPTLFCNKLIVDTDGAVTGYTLRQQDGKRKAVEALKSIGMTIVAAGDSYNDLTMIRSADRGILFKPPVRITEEHPDLPVCLDYPAFDAAIDAAFSAL